MIIILYTKWIVESTLWLIQITLVEWFKGEEKGYFEFGGSTVVMILKKDTVKIDDDIINNSSENIETRVLLGQTIGHKGV